jgi:hypothetical protein
MTEKARALLTRLATAGKPTPLQNGELVLAKELEAQGLLFIARTGAIISPRGRQRIAELAQPNQPLVFLEPQRGR